MNLRAIVRHTRIWSALNLVILAAAVLAVVTSGVCADEPEKNEWLGKRVVPKSKDFLLRDENGALVHDSIRTTFEFGIFRVESVDGNKLLLRAENNRLAIWAFAERVVLVDRAIDYFTGQIQANATDPFPYKLRAAIWLDKKIELDRAIGDLNEAIRLEPRSPDSYLIRALAWHIKKDYGKAIADCDQAIRIDPKAAMAYYNRGKILLDTGKHGGAIADLSEAIRLNPRDDDAFVLRGVCWLAKNSPQKAIIDFNDAIKLAPGNLAAYFNRSLAWLKLGELDRTIGDLSEAIRLDERRAALYDSRGTAWILKKRFDKTIADYEKALQLDPSLLSPRVTLARILASCPDETCRDGKKALESATKACELTDWKDAYILGLLAAAYAETGDFDAAAKWQKTANGLSSGILNKVNGKLRLELYRMKEPLRDDALRVAGGNR